MKPIKNKQKHHRALILSIVIAFQLFLPMIVYAQRIRSFNVKGKEINVLYLNTKIQEMMDKLGITGMSFAVIDRNKVVFNRGYGLKDRATNEKVDTATIFEEASVSKTFLVYVVHKLAGEGKLDLDRPIYHYQENPALAYDPRYKLITLRMILAHQSGLENWDWMNDKDKLEIIAEPGKKFIYSGEGYEYLAKVIEGILHKSYQQYINDEIFVPFGLKRTFTRYSDDHKFPGNYATGYTALGKPVVKSKHNFTGPAGLMEGTAGDYAKFIVSAFNGGLSAKSIHDLTTPLTPVSTNLFYGPGFEVQYVGQDTVLVHGGDNPGFQSFMCYSPHSKSGLVIFTSSERGRSVVQQLSKLLLGLDVMPSFGSLLFEQYPSRVEGLVKLYSKEGENRMWAAVEKLKSKMASDPSDKTLFDLGEMFSQENTTLAIKLLQENEAIHPKSAETNWFLGVLYMSQEKYDLAYGEFKQAKALNFELFPFDYEMNKCQEQLYHAGMTNNKP
jgi:CubicO group peptidase (beta-lactamase class C family)